MLIIFLNKAENLYLSSVYIFILQNTSKNNKFVIGFTFYKDFRQPKRLFRLPERLNNLIKVQLKIGIQMSEKHQPLYRNIVWLMLD